MSLTDSQFADLKSAMNKFNVKVKFQHTDDGIISFKLPSKPLLPRHLKLLGLPTDCMDRALIMKEFKRVSVEKRKNIETKKFKVVKMIKFSISPDGELISEHVKRLEKHK